MPAGLLETDDTYKRFVVSPPPGALVVKTSYRDNPYLSEELRVEIEHLKATDPDEYEHVYAYASFNLAPTFTALTA